MPFRKDSVGKIYKSHVGCPNSMGAAEGGGVFPCRLQFTKDTKATG